MAAVANIQASVEAITAISRGASGGFLQTRAASALELLAADPKVDVPDYARRQVLLFLSDNPFQPRVLRAVGRHRRDHEADGRRDGSGVG